MIKDEGMRFVATCAESWFSDFALLDETTLFLLAGDASEGCFFHFRNYVTATDYDTTKSYQLLDMCWVEFSDSINLS